MVDEINQYYTIDISYQHYNSLKKPSFVVYFYTESEILEYKISIDFPKDLKIFQTFHVEKKNPLSLMPCIISVSVIYAMSWMIYLTYQFK